MNEIRVIRVNSFNIRCEVWQRSRRGLELCETFLICVKIFDLNFGPDWG